MKCLFVPKISLNIVEYQKRGQKGDKLLNYVLYLQQQKNNGMANINYRISTKVDKKSGKSEILMRFNASKENRLRAKTNIFVIAKYWSDKKQTILIPELAPQNVIDDCIKQRGRLIELANFILDKYTFASVANKDWLNSIIAEFNKPHDNNANCMLISALIRHYENLPKVIQRNGKPIAKSSIMSYHATESHLKKYAQKCKVADFVIKELDEDFYDGFVNFLYDEGLLLNTIGGDIANIKAVIHALPLKFRFDCQFIESKHCKALHEQIDNVYLNEAELKKIENFKSDNEKFNIVRDDFILMCWTGCRYSDLGKLVKENIAQDGFFHIEQRKTGANVIIPIFPAVRRIFKRYNNVLPKPLSHDQFNEYIRSICRKVGIKNNVKITHTEKGKRVSKFFEKCDLVTAHTARRSFATNMYNRNFPTLMIMRVTGHKTEKNFLNYIKITAEENADKMMKLFKKQEKEIKETERKETERKEKEKLAKRKQRARAKMNI